MLGLNLTDRAGAALGGFLPRLAGAVVLLVVGLIAVRVLARLLRRALVRVGVDGLAERWGVHRFLERAGLERSLAHVTAVIIRVALSLVVIFAALSLLGLQFLSESLNQFILFLPRLLAALALLLAGLVLASVVRERLDRTAYQMDFPIPLGRLAQIAVVAVFVLTAAAQVALATTTLMILVGIVVAAAAATLSLAFGLGGRDVARALSAGRYIDVAFETGQTIGVGDVRGEILAIEPTVTVLRTDDGLTVRVPNHLLLESVVTVHQGQEGTPR